MFKTNSIKNHLIIFGLILASCSAIAQLGGTTVFSSDLIAKSAREAGIGGESGAHGLGDVGLIAANPAFADSTTHNQLAMTFNNSLGDVRGGRMSYAYYLKDVGTVGISASFVDYGEFSRRDQYGVANGTFSAGDQTISLIYSRRLQRGFRFGAALKTMFSTIDTYQATALAFDIGGLYVDPTERFFFTAEVNNLGMMLTKFSGDQREDIPLKALISANYKFDRLPLRAIATLDNLQTWDLTYQGLNDPNPAIDPFTGNEIDPMVTADKLMRHVLLGVEFVPAESFYIQFGYNYRRRKELKFVNRAGLAGVSLGVGVRVAKMNFNYAYSKYHLSASEHQFTLALDLNRFKHRQTLRQEKRVREENKRRS